MSRNAVIKKEKKRKMMIKNITKLLYIPFLAMACTSCLYEMPDEDTVHTVPVTNNPHVIKDSAPTAAPSIEY
jgi:hypothetical protein